MDELEIDGKIYLSSKAAAKLTGYAKDYVGQLCREGRVNARLVGRSWYVLEESIKSHRFGQEAEIDTPSIKKEANTEDKERFYEENSIEEKEVTEESPTYNVDFEHVYFPDDAQPIEDKAVEVQETTPVEEPEETEHISAMQDVWKEWFEHKGKHKEPAIELKDEINENENTSYLLDSSEEIESKEESVPVHIVHKEKERVAVEVDYMAPVEQKENYMPVVEKEREVIEKSSKAVTAKHQRTYLGLKAGLIGLVFVSVSITLIALGFFEPIGTTNNPIFLYLSGETKI